MKHFLFGIHCHQPLDNFHNVVDTAIAESYLPFLKTAVKFPGFKFAVHYSGWLLEYIRDHNPETFGLLQKLAQSGQVEFFSGGFYEPILAVIPSKYRQMQINKLNGFIYEHFGQKPKGLWLTERVWDPAIIPDLTACGIEYVIVDDYHFIAAGFDKNSLYGYYQTEQGGCRIKVFPVDQKLRYIVPYKEVPEIDEYLGTIADIDDRAAVIFDDGEKFGLWPDSFEWVYEKGWLERFMAYMSETKTAVSSHFSEFAAKARPLGMAYLPSVSYHEMGEWALFADKFVALEKVKQALKNDGLAEAAESFVKGSIWQNFLVKYPEANRMHKRSLGLALQAGAFNDAALNELVLKTQVNDALWHGIFGGLYLPNLRNNLYRYIIDAGTCLDNLANTHFPVAEADSFDYDGFAKISLRTAKANFIFDLRDNGQLIALDDRTQSFNYQNTLARRREGYHEQMLAAKPETKETANGQLHEDGIATIHEAVLEVDDTVKEYLNFDWYNRNSFIDHVTEGFDFKAFRHCTFHELSNLTNTPADNYSLTDSAAETAVTFTKNGGIFKDGNEYACALTKKFAVNARSELAFEIKLNAKLKKSYTYVMELNFHFNDFKALKINDTALYPEIELKGDAFVINDGNLKPLQITFDREVELYAAVIHTVSQSEKDVDLTAQGLALFVPFEFNGNLAINGVVQVLE